MGAYAEPQLEENFESTARLQEGLFTLEKGISGVRVPTMLLSFPQVSQLADRRGKPSLVRFWGHVWCTPCTGFQMEVWKTFKCAKPTSKSSWWRQQCRTESRLQNKLTKFSVVQMQLICSTYCAELLEKYSSKSSSQQLHFLKSQLRAVECSVPAVFPKNHALADKPLLHLFCCNVLPMPATMPSTIYSHIKPKCTYTRFS